MLQQPASPSLVLDACSDRIQVGVMADGQWQHWLSREGSALENLFELTAECLDSCGLELAGVASFVFAAGPGSMLGIRLTAMAINTWRARPGCQAGLLAYRSLDLAACDVAASGDIPAFRIASQLRRNSFIAIDCNEGSCGSPTVCKLENLQAAPIPVFELRLKQADGNHAEAPFPIRSYSIEHLPERLRSGQLELDACEQAEAFQIHKPEYQRWQGDRHR